MNQKRGQVTFFVIIGIVIFVVISLTVYIFFVAQPEAEKIPFEYTDVETFVTGCLDGALSSGVSYCSGGDNCPNYEEDLGGQVVTVFFDCTGNSTDHQKGEIQTQFPLYEIKVGNADIDIVQSAKKIEAVLSFPVTIKREGKEHTIRSFRSVHHLESGACIPCPHCDENCILQGDDDLEVTILDLRITFTPGEFVGLIAEECLAC